jgi:tape measure domain-containing protein
MNDQGLYFKVRLDNGKLKIDVDQSEQIIKGLSNSVKRESRAMENALSGVKAGIAGAFTLAAAQNFASQVVKVRGEIQALEGSFRTLLGSKAQGDKMLAEVRKYATETPYGLQDISKAAQTMLAFNIDAQKVIPTLKQMGDIAMGDGQKLQSLVLAFSQMSSTGRLMGQDLLQMINAGFNPLVQISEKTGKSIDTLKSEMEKGKISVAMVTEAFAAATSEGGKFHGMMEQQAQGINANLAQLEDAWINFYNEIGEKSEGLIVDSIQGLTHLIENYEQVGKAIGEIIVLYGSYKAALIAIQALHKASIALQAQMVIVQRAAAISQATLTTSQITATAVTRALQVAWSRLNATMLVNPYVLAAGAITALGYAIYKMSTATSEAEERAIRLQEAKDEATKSAEKENIELERLFHAYNKAVKGTEGYEKAKKAIIDKYGTQIAQLQGENKEVWNLSAAYDQLKKSAIEAANARAYQRYADESDTRTADIIASEKKNLEKELIAFYGGNKNKAYGDIRYINELLNSGNEIPKEFLSRYNQTNYRVDNLGVGGREGGMKIIKTNTNEILNSITAISAAVKTNKEEIKEAKELFGIKEGDAVVIEPEVKTLPPKPELTDAEKNELARRKKRHEEALRREKEYRQELEQLYLESQMELTEKRIAAMDEGYEKELAQIEFNHKRMLFENEKRLKEALEKERDIQEVLWEGDPKNADKIKSGEIFNRESVTMETLRKNNPQALEVYEQYVKLAASIREKAEFEATKKIAKNTEDTAIQTAEKIADQAFRWADVRKNHADSILSGTIFNWETDRKVAALIIELSNLEEKLEALKRLQEQNPTDETAADIEDISNNIKKVNNELEKTPNEKLIEMVKYFGMLAQKLGGLGGSVGEFFSGLASEIDNLTIALDKSASKTQKYAAAISAAVGMINMIVSASKNRKLAEEEYYRNAIALSHNYALALNEQLRLQGQLSGGGFMRDYSSEITSSFKAMTEASKSYNDALKKLEEGKAKVGNRDAIDWGNVGSGAASGAAIGATIGSVVPVIGNVVGGVVGAVVGGIVGLFGGKKKKDIFGGLLDVYPELIDGQGKLNKELAEQLIATNQLDDNTKQLVQNVLDWDQALKESSDAIREITVQLADDLGVSIHNALVDAFAAGEDASERMFDAANRSLGSFIDNLLYSTIFSDTFKNFGQRLADSLNIDSGGDGNIVDDYQWLMDKLEEGSEEYEKRKKELQDYATSQGFNLWSTTDMRVGANKGLAAMSQDTAEELNGRFTAIQGHTYSMMNNIADIKSMFEIDQTRAAQQLVHLANIDSNTSRLSSIESDMKGVRNAIELISERGIKLR